MAIKYYCIKVNLKKVLAWGIGNKNKYFENCNNFTDSLLRSLLKQVTDRSLIDFTNLYQS